MLEAGLAEVLSFTVAPNIRSPAVMRRLGLRYDGVVVRPRASAGQWWGPHVLYRAATDDLAPSTVPSGRTHP